MSILGLLARIISNPKRECLRNGMKMGNNCSIMSWLIVGEAYLIEIGDNVQITDGVHIFTHGGGHVLRTEVPDYDSFGKVKIGNNVYIGNNAVIMPGVTIGNNVIIGACSVVTKNVPDNVVIGGNPAHVINTFENYRTKMLQWNLHCKQMSAKEKKKYLLSISDDMFIKVNQSL